MSQTKLRSFIEANTNSIIGYFVSLVIGIWLYPAVGCDFTLATNAFVTGVFVVVSTVRSYIVRRLYNWLDRRN